MSVSDPPIDKFVINVGEMLLVIWIQLVVFDAAWKVTELDVLGVLGVGLDCLSNEQKDI